MLYLEDYLESTYFATKSRYVFLIPLFTVIEHLPQELRDRFTDMRELDLSVQSKWYDLSYSALFYFKMLIQR